MREVNCEYIRFFKMSVAESSFLVTLIFLANRESDHVARYSHRFCLRKL